MDTDFDFSRDALYRINGNQANDLPFAKACTTKMLNFVENKRNTVEEFLNFKKIITNSALVEIYDSLTAINYICSELNKLTIFFERKNEFRTVFDIAHNKAQEELKSVRNNVKELREIIIKPQ